MGLCVNQSERWEKDLFFFCCGGFRDSGFNSPYLLLKIGALVVLQCAQKIESVEAMMVEEKYGGLESEVVEKGKLIPPDCFVHPNVVEEKNDESEEEDKEKDDGKYEVLLSPSTINGEVLATVEANAFKELQAIEDVKVDDGADCEISLGSEICDQELIEQTQLHESVLQPEAIAHQFVENFDEANLRDPVSGSETKPSGRTASQVQNISVSPFLNEVQEELMPETPKTPNSVESFHLLDKRLLLERKSGSESLDNIIASDMDNNTEYVTIDRLKEALKSERKALTALYTELEEERSASTIAANQTMAMITRLQEEKAAMQMEALHYQRMMEEQSEYDHKSLQLLNELVRKMEKELVLQREKVRLYEARERRKMNGISSNTFTSEESDDLSLDEKLLAMEDEDGSFDINPIMEHLSDENGHGIRGKTLLPLFDARSLENEEDKLHQRQIIAQFAR